MKKKITDKRLNNAPSSWYLWEKHKEGNLKPEGYEILRLRMYQLAEICDIDMEADFIEYMEDPHPLISHGKR